VPSKAYKIPTAQLKEGVVAVNFSESKNFEADVKDKVRRRLLSQRRCRSLMDIVSALGLDLLSWYRKSDDRFAATKSAEVERLSSGSQEWRNW